MATLPCAGYTFGSDGHPWYLRRLLGENFTRRARTKFPPIQCIKTAVCASWTIDPMTAMDRFGSHDRCGEEEIILSSLAFHRDLVS